MRGETLLSPSGTVTSWGNTFSWTGHAAATYYLVEVQKTDNTTVLRKWYTAAQAGCAGGTACSISPVELATLANGDYKWHMRDYGAYGYGLFTPYMNFTLNAACYTLGTAVAPALSGVVNVNTGENCTGGYTAGTVVQVSAVPNTGFVFTGWSGDASGTSNPVSVTMDGSKSVTADMRGETLLSPTGTLTSWGNTFSWTGHAASHLLPGGSAEDGQHPVLRKWYTAAQTGCAGGTACSISPAELATLANGDYKWHMRDYGAYGYGPFTPYTNFTLNVPVACEDVLYVDVDLSASAPDGCSWGTAYPTLQDALAIATSGKQIWVAQGTYYPDEGAGQTNDARESTFTLIDGVSVYGGFAGSETLLTQRNPVPDTNNTVLSGDIDATPGTITGDAYHVVTAANITSVTELSGFAIRKGNARADDGFGGGLRITSCSGNFRVMDMLFTDNTAYSGGGIATFVSDPAITRVVFSANYVLSYGGGFYNQNGSPSLIDVTFENNWTIEPASPGGGMHSTNTDPGIYTVAPVLTNVTFSNNSALAGGGGAMFNNLSDTVYTNVTFTGNSANVRGGAILNEGSSPVFNNVTFSGNTAANPAQGNAMINILSGATPSAPVINNSILWETGDADIVNEGGSTVTINDSIMHDGSCPAGGACTNVQFNADPVLGALADNGGFTRTMALGTGSSAIDAGNNITCAATDQRGVTRPQGLICDVGAYELEVAP